MNPKSLLLHKKALRISKALKTNYSDMIDVTQEILVARSYFDFNRKSAFEYATEELEVSESTVQAIIRIAKVSFKIPRLKAEIRAGRVDFWKANKICSVINEDNQDRWISMAQYRSKVDIEFEISKDSPRAAIRDKVTKKMVGDEEWYKLNFGMQTKTMEKFKRVQDLESTRLGRPARLEEVIDAMAETHLDKVDPLRKKSKHHGASHARPGTSETAEAPAKEQQVDNDSKRRKIRVTVKRRVHQDNNGQCMYVSEEGCRCQERRFLEIHHKVPISEGGTNHIENLMILCAAHHQMHHHLEVRGD